jgi:N-acetylglucosaminyl-diphospho-decaprenol L-rhamnosyltransferase
MHHDVEQITPKPSDTSVAAVVIHYGDPGRTIRAVRSHHELGLFSDIIVVANDLSERPEALINMPCRWLVPARNIGFGGACQMAAMAYSHAEIYAFFNSHVTITRNAAEGCLAAFAKPDVGIAAPYIYHPTRKKPDIDWKYTYCTRTYSRILQLPVQVPIDRDHVNRLTKDLMLIDNDWATGGAIFCRKEVINKIGWDGSYFLGYEDVDISLRAKKNGWRVVVAPSALALHTGESTKTSTISTYYSTRNSLWFARKHRGPEVRVLITAYLLLRLCRLAAADLLKRRNPPHARAALKGLMHGWRLWPTDVHALSGEPLWPSPARNGFSAQDSFCLNGSEIEQRDSECK